MLAAFRLALHHDAGWQVRKAHRRLDFIHVLPSVASRAERVDFEVLGAYIDFDAVVHLGNYKHGRERSMATRGLVEWRNADEAVHSGFSGKQPIGILAFHADRDGLEPSALARLRIDHRSMKTLALTPAQIHAQEHLRPVLRFRAARA